jgi:Ca2+-binding EF-hand superfamily protein
MSSLAEMQAEVETARAVTQALGRAVVAKTSELAGSAPAPSQLSLVAASTFASPVTSGSRSPPALATGAGGGGRRQALEQQRVHLAARRQEIEAKKAAWRSAKAQQLEEEQLVAATVIQARYRGGKGRQSGRKVRATKALDGMLQNRSPPPVAAAASSSSGGSSAIYSRAQQAATTTIQAVYRGGKGRQNVRKLAAKKALGEMLQARSSGQSAPPAVTAPRPTSSSFNKTTTAERQPTPVPVPAASASASAATGTANEEEVEVECPEGVSAGDLLDIDLGDGGGPYEVAVPAGVQPGGLFTVLLPKTQEAKAAAHSGANSGSDGSPSTAAAVLAANPRPPLSLRRQFDRYDQGRKGYLDIRDLEALMSELGYDSDPNYLQGLKQSFARFDEDGNGTIELAEFQALWTHLGGDVLLAAQEDTGVGQQRTRGNVLSSIQARERRKQSRASLLAVPVDDPMRRRFERYDVDGSGQLTRYEVQQICTDLEYDVDEEYVAGVMDQFSSFDVDGDGLIEFDEFAKMWEHLGGNTRADMLEALPAAETVGSLDDRDQPVPIEQQQLRAQFRSFDEASKGHLDASDVAAVMSSLGFGADIQYIEQAMLQFGRPGENNHHVLGLAEFLELWRHLGGDATAQVSNAERNDPLLQRFSRYDVNRSGMISEYEVEQLCLDLGYDVDQTYIAGLMQQFAAYDEDGDGQLNFQEFKRVWEHLGGEERAREAEAAAAAAVQIEENDVGVSVEARAEERQQPERGEQQTVEPLDVTFDRYDQGRKGYLDIRDLEALMSELGYDSDPNYLQGLKQSFARFDEDGNGTIELAEFQALWTHLGGDERVTGQTEAVVDASDGDDEATVLLRRRFRQYDVNQSGQLSHYEVEMICVDLGYDVDSKYVSGLMQQFAEFDKNHDGSIRYVVCLKNALVENKPLTAATLCIAQLRRVWNAMGIPWW